MKNMNDNSCFMDKKTYKKIAFSSAPNAKIVFCTKKIIINFVPYGKCTNSCVFCGPNINAMKKITATDVLLKNKYSVDEMIKATIYVYKNGKNYSEIVITGTIGEPLLFFKKLLKLIKELKKNLPLPVRLNTNGQASVILSKPEKNICEKLKQVGLDAIAISLNAINNKDYNKLCKPKNKNAFGSVVRFIKAANNSGIKTYISFVDYTKEHPEYPKINKIKIKRFCKTAGLENSQIIFRPMIE